MAPRDTPDSRLTITDELVSALVAEQFPDLASRDVGRHYLLEDHVSVRLGDDFGAIFPTINGVDEQYARVTDLVAPHIENWTFPWSAPVRTGKPSADYPYHWVIVPWITASTAAFVPLHASAAPLLGKALKELHTRAPKDAAKSFRTSATLNDLTDEWDALVEAVASTEAPENRVLNIDTTRMLWSNALATKSTPPLTWTHGNLEPRAILSDQGRFAGILLWHCFGAGNPEIDLGAASLLVPTDHRAVMLDAYGKVSSESLARIQAFELLAACRYIAGGDPFRARLAWERLIELDLVVAS